MDCTQTTLNLFLIAFTAAMGVVKFTIDYFRHAQIMNDNQRILHVVEGKTEFPSDVE